MSLYTSMRPNLRLTLNINGGLQSVNFKQGVFETEDPTVQAALEAHPLFNRIVRGEKHGEVKTAQGPADKASEAPKPEAKPKSRKRSKAREAAAIKSFMEKEVNA